VVPYGLVTASHVLNAVASTALRHISHLASAFVDDIIIAAPKVPGSTLDEAFALPYYRQYGLCWVRCARLG